jgi:hypothetical protein
VTLRADMPYRASATTRASTKRPAPTTSTVRTAWAETGTAECEPVSGMGLTCDGNNKVIESRNHAEAFVVTV